jgi:hypothetical protein
MVISLPSRSNDVGQETGHQDRIHRFNNPKANLRLAENIVNVNIVKEQKVKSDNQHPNGKVE